MTATSSEGAVEHSVKAPSPEHETEVDNNVSIWRSVAVVAMVASVVGISATSSIDLCSSVGPWVLGLAWLVIPVVAISSIIAVSLMGKSIFERITAALIAGAITGAWLFALSWASVGEAMQRTVC